MIRNRVAWELLIGLGLLWTGLNYVPLLIHAIDLARRGTARQESAYELAHPELARRYGIRQFWILVPFAVVAMDLVQRSRRAHDLRSVHGPNVPRA